MESTFTTTDTSQHAPGNTGDDYSCGLEAIILHNTFEQVRNRTLRIDCRQRTHISGLNGAGKTSIMTLTPAFYGEEPDRLVARGPTRKSFVDYYLPFQNSLIIFEYRRPTGLCCSVMLRHPSGKIVYRFVDGGVAETFFAPGVDQMLADGCTANDIFDQLRENGVEHSRIIDTITDYRAILQHNSRLLKRRHDKSHKSTLRSLANDFSLGGPRSAMSHIERLTHVVLNRQRLVSSFKAMICETQFDDIHVGEPPTAQGQQELVNDIRSIEAFAREQSQLRTCLEKDGERQELIKSAQARAGRLAMSLTEARERRDELYQEIEQLNQQLEDAKQKFDAKTQSIDSDISQKKGDYHDCQNRIDALYKQQQDYDDKGMAELAREWENLHHYQQELERAENDLGQMTGQVEELERDYKQAIAEIEKAFERDQAQRKSEVQNANHALETARKDRQQALSDHDAKKERDFSELRTARTDARQALAVKRAEVKTLRDKEGPTQKEQQRLEAVDEQSRSADALVLQCHDWTSQTQTALGQAREQRSNAQAQLSKIDREIEHLNNDRQSIVRQLNPEDGSWRALLRDQHPDWDQSLAKVINPALLERKDLDPRLQDMPLRLRETVMGWSLALGAIDTPDFAVDDQTLKHRIEALDEQLGDARRRRSEADTHAGSCNTAVTEAERACERAKVDLSRAQTQQQQAHNDLDSVREQIKSAQQQRVEQHSKDLEALDRQIREHDEQTREQQKALEARFAEQRKALERQWDEHLQDLEARKRDAEKRLEQAERDHKQRMERRRQVYEQQLHDKGVDPSLIQAQRETVGKLEKRITHIQNHQQQIREYNSWCQYNWPQLDNLTRTANTLQNELAEYERRRQELDEALTATKRDLTQKKREHNKGIQRLEKQIQEADNTLQKVPFEVERADGEIPGDLERETENLQHDCQHLTDLKRTVLKGLQRAEGIINQYATTQIYEAWQKHGQARRAKLSDPSMEHEEAFRLERVNDLRLLLDADLPHLREGVIEQFTNEAGRVKAYFEGLQNLAREVKQVSNRLHREINTNQMIEAITDIQIELHSRFEQHESWQPLKAFVGQWDDWHARNPGTLPPRDMVASFQNVCDTLTSVRAKDDLASLIDMTIHMRENNQPVAIRNDNDFLNASSEGLSYLAIMAVFMGMTRYLCPDHSIRITWPIDEFGKLDSRNISRLAEMLQRNNLTMISACPELNGALRRFFENKISIRDGRVYTKVARPDLASHSVGSDDAGNASGASHSGPTMASEESLS